MNNSDTDSAIIAIGNGTAFPDVTDTTFHHRAISTTGTRGDSYDIVNASTCVRGVSGDLENPTTSCSLIAVNVTVTYDAFRTFGQTTLLQVRRVYDGFGYRPGVSGGAVISQYEGSEYTDATHIFSRPYSRALGIVSGYSGGSASNPEKGLYTHIREAVDALSVVVKADTIDQVP